MQYVSGYWQINNNHKRNHLDYLANLKATISMLGGNKLIFYTNSEQIIDFVNDISLEFNVDTHSLLIQIDELPTWTTSSKLIDTCRRMRLDYLECPDDLGREKGTIHYWRDYKTNPIAYHKLSTIWTSKIPLTYSTMQKFSNITETAWIDAGISRFQHRRSNWNFIKIKTSSSLISHYASTMTYYGKLLPINASYMQGDREAWANLHKEFTSLFPLVCKTAYAHDEETILGLIHQKNIKMFHCIGKPYAITPKHNLIFNADLWFKKFKIISGVINRHI